MNYPVLWAVAVNMTLAFAVLTVWGVGWWLRLREEAREHEERYRRIQQGIHAGIRRTSGNIV